MLKTTFFGTVERLSKGSIKVPKYNSAENIFLVQQCRKSSFFGIVEQFFFFGTFFYIGSVVLPPLYFTSRVGG